MVAIVVYRVRKSSAPVIPSSRHEAAEFGRAAPPTEITSPETTAAPRQSAPETPPIAFDADTTRTIGNEHVVALTPQPLRRTKFRIAAIAGVLIAALLLYLALSPNVLNGFRSLLFGAAPSEAVPAKSKPAPLMNEQKAQQTPVAIDPLVQKLLETVRTARKERTAVSVAGLVGSQSYEVRAEYAPLRAAVAEQERKMVAVRQSARETFERIATAMLADHESAYQALLEVENLPAVAQDPGASLLLATLPRIEFRASRPGRFVDDGMAAWERAVATPGPGTQSPPPQTGSSPKAIADGNDQPQQSDNEQPRAPLAAPSAASSRYSRQEGNARQRQVETQQRVAPIPADEFQR